MKLLCKLIAEAVVIAVIAPMLAWSQQEPAPSANLFFDQGVISGGAYTNQCLGISFPIPQGWQVTTIPGLKEGKALHMPGMGLSLLSIGNRAGQSFDGHISLMAVDASKATLTLQESVSSSAHRMVDADPQRREIIHDAFTVSLVEESFSARITNNLSRTTKRCMWLRSTHAFADTRSARR